MTGQEYRDTLDRLGLTVDGAAKFLRLGARNSRRIADGEERLQWARAALLRVMMAYRISTEQVEGLTEDLDSDE
jgi:hypothetical protein